MKQLITLLFALPLFVNAQTLVSTMPQQRTALLEEFTAINCGNCPAAHATSANLFTQYGIQLVGIEVHGGSLAVPSTGQPDFRTTDGAALWSAFGVSFQPQGMVNRQSLSGASSWNNAIGQIVTQISPANIGIASSVESDVLTVMVEVYYTAAPASMNDEIHVALTQDHISGYQQDYVNGAQPNYDHRHVLRDMITPVDGDPVATNTMGTLVERTYILQLDPSWDIANLRVVASVGPTAGAIYQVRQVNADGGITTAVNEQTSNTLGLGKAYPVPANNVVNFSVDPSAAGQLLVLRDELGRIVAQQRVAEGQALVTIGLDGIAAGLYHAGFVGGSALKVVVE